MKKELHRELLKMKEQLLIFKKISMNKLSSKLDIHIEKISQLENGSE